MENQYIPMEKMRLKGKEISYKLNEKGEVVSFVCGWCFGTFELPQTLGEFKTNMRKFIEEKFQ